MKHEVVERKQILIFSTLIIFVTVHFGIGSIYLNVILIIRMTDESDRLANRIGIHTESENSSK